MEIQQERYYDYMVRNMKEEDIKVGKENAMKMLRE